MMGEKAFQLHVSTPTYAIHPMSLNNARQEVSLAGSSFPAGVQ